MGLLDVVKAWQEGKEIQYRNSPEKEWKTIHSGDSFELSFKVGYRVKPVTVVRWCFTIIYPETGAVVVRAKGTRSEAHTRLNTFLSQGWKVLEDVTRKEWELGND